MWTAGGGSASASAAAAASGEAAATRPAGRRHRRRDSVESVVGNVLPPCKLEGAADSTHTSSTSGGATKTESSSVSSSLCASGGSAGRSSSGGSGGGGGATSHTSHPQRSTSFGSSMDGGHPQSHKRPRPQRAGQPISKRMKKETSVKVERQERAAEQRQAKAQQLQEHVTWVHTSTLWMYEQWMDKSAASDSDTAERGRGQSPAFSTHSLPPLCCECILLSLSSESNRVMSTTMLARTGQHRRDQQLRCGRPTRAARRSAVEWRPSSTPSTCKRKRQQHELSRHSSSRMRRCKRVKPSPRLNPPTVFVNSCGAA